jgi:DNA-binding MarR family transcriptional regulator
LGGERGVGEEPVAIALGSAIARLARQLRDTSNLPAGMTPERLGTLAMIGSAEASSVSELADAEGVRPATMSRRVSDLVEAGWVRRRPDGTDRRAIQLSLTVRGRRVFEGARRGSHSSLAEALKLLTAAERAQLRQLAAMLERLSDVLSQTIATRARRP